MGVRVRDACKPTAVHSFGIEQVGDNKAFTLFMQDSGYFFIVMNEGRKN